MITIRVYIPASISSYLGYFERGRGSGYFPVLRRRYKRIICGMAGMKILKIRSFISKIHFTLIENKN